VTLWRISSHRRLDGAGGLLAPGRWHTQGSRAVYCAPNPATALVDVLVHIEIEPGDLPDPLQYLEIEAPDVISLETVDVEALGRHWQKDQIATRRAGDEWLRAESTAVLRVLSNLHKAVQDDVIASDEAAHAGAQIVAPPPQVWIPSQQPEALVDALHHNA
jgi:RES domain-containing protein